LDGRLVGRQTRASAAHASSCCPLLSGATPVAPIAKPGQSWPDTCAHQPAPILMHWRCGQRCALGMPRPRLRAPPCLPHRCRMIRKDPSKRPTAAQLLQMPELQEAVQKAVLQGASLVPGFVMPTFTVRALRCGLPAPAVPVVCRCGLPHAVLRSAAGTVHARMPVCRATVGWPLSAVHWHSTGSNPLSTLPPGGCPPSLPSSHLPSHKTPCQPHLAHALHRLRSALLARRQQQTKRKRSRAGRRT
jgi:hypothetical protein